MVARSGTLPFVRPSQRALALVPAQLQGEIRRVCRDLLPGLECLVETASFVSRVEAGCPQLLIVDTDLIGCPSDLARFARSLRPDVKVLGLSWYWSDRDELLRACLDGILHKPPRRPQWVASLRRAGALAVDPPRPLPAGGDVREPLPAPRPAA